MGELPKQPSNGFPCKDIAGIFDSGQEKSAGGCRAAGFAAVFAFYYRFKYVDVCFAQAQIDHCAGDGSYHIAQEAV